MFRSEGDHDVTIIDAFIAEPKFPAGNSRDDAKGNSFGQQIQVWGDIVLKIQDKDGNNDEWHGEISNRTGTGNYVSMTKTDQTLKTLQDIGFGVNDFNALNEQIIPDGTIPNLVGLEATAVVVKSTSTGRDGKEREFYNVRYLNSKGGNVKRLNKDGLLKSFQTGGFTAEAPATAPRQAAAQAAPAQVQAPAAPPAPAPVQPQATMVTPPIHSGVPGAGQSGPSAPPCPY